MLLSSDTSKRFLALLYLVLVYVVMSTIFKFVFRSFLMFCVVYTVSDCYKKRKKLMWVWIFTKTNIKFVTYAFLGDQCFQFLSVQPRGNKLKKKI